MKRILFLCLGCLLFSPLVAQVGAPNKLLSYDSNMSERLVTLAFQNPDLEVADHEIKIAKYNLSAAKGWWAENLSLSFNANEYSLKKIGQPVVGGAYYGMYPLYNMGINIPIGGIFSKPQAVKAARERVAIAQASRNSKYRQIRAAVLTAYENYLTSQELLTVQSQITESLYNDYLQAKERFRNGQVSVDEYNKSIQAYHDQLTGRINAQHNLNLTKIQLEALIGVPLDKVLNSGVQPASSDSTASH